MIAVRTLGVGLLVALTALILTPAQADVIYSQPLNSSQLDMYYSGFPYMACVDNPDLPAAAVVTAVRWWGCCVGAMGTPPPEDHFTIDFFQSFADLGTPLASFTLPAGEGGRADTGLALGGSFPIYSYSYTLPTPVSLDSGTNIIAIVNDTNSVFPPMNWFWMEAQSGYGDDLHGTFYPPDPNSTFATADHDLAFELEGSVPEPSTLMLVGSGFAGLFGLVRRRRMN